MYEIEWQIKPRHVETLERKNGFHKAGSWLIFADSQGVGQTLAKLLESRGDTCILVYAGDIYSKKQAGSWSINPSKPTDFEQLFQEVLATLKQPLQGVVHLWSLQAELASTLTISSLEYAQNLGVGSVMHILQALSKGQEEFYSHPPRLWLLTRGAMPIGSDIPGVAQAPLWGLGKVVALEHPDLWGGIFDLAPESTSDEEVAKVLAEIEDSQGEDHLAFRNGNRYVARLAPKQLPGSKKVVIHSDSTYLITGGLGALGLLVAQWMVSKGARQLVLTGRSSASEQAQLILRQLEQQGVKVLVQKADVSHEGDMFRVLKTVNATMPPLRGIVHAAGVLDDGILQQHSWERFSRVIAPKVQGTWNLHSLTQGLSLDFFVLFSSAASLLGSAGQGNYAAANSFMDVLAHHRRTLGLPGLSINWGPWANMGMVAHSGDALQAANATLGVDSIAPDLGLLILEQMLGQATSQIGVLPIDWSVFKRQLRVSGQLRPLFLELFAKIETQKETDSASVQRSDILQQLQASAASDRLSLLTAYIQGEVAKVLRLAPSQLPDLKQNFFDMGMDSLMAVEFKNNLQRDLGEFLPPTLIFNYPNINTIAQYLSQEVLSLEVSAQVSQDLLESQQELTTSLEELKQLSESEVMGLIAEEFEAYH